MTLDEALVWSDKFAESLTPTTSTVTAFTLATEVRRLQAEMEESDAVRDKCARLLAETAVALKGEEAALSRHSWHDLPEVAAIMRAENTALRLYAPAQRAGAMQPPVQIATTRWPFWMNETDEEFKAWGNEHTEAEG